ncbi:tudor and KH domain-containing protein [Caerostris darwini]|uniref:Tudor and KH domain-containing protein n=1 Tax=Caerostris darwini TaxID=1538125 RepID=A0AAV4RCT8_9ARAC|nr:tudor and KH domain-containing protein [Caerostris darwini]
MIKLISKPYIIIGVGVGVGVITCVVKVLQWQNNKGEIIRTETKRVTRTIKIPKGFVGHVLGRGGQNIKSIREKTKARITFDDIDTESTLVTIQGLPESAEEAANLINDIVSNRHACITKEIVLQENVTDSVWKNINCIRQICDFTKARITFEFRSSSNNRDSEVKIFIKGNKEEVQSAVELVDELIAEVEVNTSKQIHVAGWALPENLPLPTTTFGHRNLQVEKLIPSSSDGYQEMYVSAVENPNKFWIQIAGSKSTQLDKLVTEMTEFYNDGKNKEKFRLNNINVGDIVAAYFDDKSWYRAQIMKVSDEDDEEKIRVFYLDFGDCANLSSDLVCLLKSDFLSIAFQAIECSLPDVAPIDKEWTVEAIEDFERMVYVAEWKLLMAKPIEKPIRNGEKHEESIQFIQIMDTNTERDINISEELVVKAFARFV